MKAHKGDKREKRGRRGEGRLYKRLPGGRELPATSEATAPYWLEYRANGERIRTQLRDANGQPITDRAEADAARHLILAPFQAKDDLEAQRQIAARIQTAETRLAAAVESANETANPPLHLADAWQEYLASTSRPDSGPLTLKHYSRQLGRFTAWMGTRRPGAAVRDVTDTDAEAYAAHLAAKVGAATFNKNISLLSLVFRVLRKPAKLAANPFDEIRHKRATVNSRRELTIDELRAVCASATGEIRTLLAVGIYTGLRLGDCATLRWGEVDLVRGIVSRIPNKTGRHNPKPVLVPIHPALAAMLAETPASRRRGFVMPDTAAAYAVNLSRITNRVQKLLNDVGVQTKTASTPGRRAVVNAGFHSLRHSFVSLCRAAGAPLSVVESIVGHSSPAMTRHYTHTGMDAAQTAIDGLPNVNAPALPAGDTATTTPAPTVESLTGQLGTLRAAVGKFAEKLTAANVEQTRAALVTLAKGGAK